jgi:hypothetical protein
LKTHVFVICALIGLLSISCSKDDDSKFHYKTITDVDALHTTVVYENAYVKIVDIDLHPGEMIPAHDAGMCLTYSLSDYDVTVVEGEQRTVNHRNSGDVNWHDLATVSLENNDTVDVKFSIIRRTENDLPGFDLATLEDDVTEHSNQSVVLIENDRIKVVQITLAAGDSIPKHAGINRLYLPQSNYDIILQVDDVGNVELTHSVGDYRFFKPGAHGVTNIGNTEAVYLLVSFKQ